MTYTFPQTFEDFKTVQRLVVQRQTWWRPVMIALVLFGLAIVLYPLITRNPPTFWEVIMNAAPYLLIITLWITLLTGYPRVMFIVLTALGLVPLFVLIVTGHATSVGVIIASIWPYACIIALLTLLANWAPRRYRANAHYQGDMTVELGPEEIRAIRPSNTMTFRWSGIARAAETPQYFLIFVIKSSAFYIPKRVIPPADLPELRTFLRAHVPSGLL